MNVECNLIPSPVLGMRLCGVVLQAGATYLASKVWRRRSMTAESMAKTGTAITSRCREEVAMVLWLVSLLATFLWRAHRRCWRNGALCSVPLTWPWLSRWTCSQRCFQPPSHHSTTTEASSKPLHVPCGLFVLCHLDAFCTVDITSTRENIVGASHCICWALYVTLVSG